MSAFKGGRRQRSPKDSRLTHGVGHFERTSSLVLMLFKKVIFLDAEPSADDLVVIAFGVQGQFRIPWREFKTIYETNATAAVKDRGWNLHNLDEASQSLLAHGTLEPGQLEKCRSRKKRPGDSFILGEVRSAFD